ncbi:MAG: sulfotransferase domain-containing protein [Oscillatoria sp. PMC 1051.18]|nr:sulfotransferase domain-containing protein [Oscillatoria sp. PMC 1050.18]MEC5030103.1 sulfotransferase domain-containing protein [Oscillatoria sp. PMC 1051.18]
MKKPNFFIIGAPKCGTTALSEYLKTHPNVYLSSPKEPHYFAEAEFNTPNLKTWEQYLKLFEEATDKHLAIGEASVHYLYSSIALQRIYEYNSKAKIIAMFRNPVDLVYSYHSQLVYNYDEDEKDFEKAWSLQKSRQEGFNLPKLAQNPYVFQYKSIGQLGSQVEKLLQIFPSEQVKLILFDEFKSSTATIYREVLEFLELPDDGRVDFPRINANRKHKIAWLGIITEKTPPSLMKTAAIAKKVLGVESFGLVNKIRQTNREEFKRKPLSSDFRAKLIEEFSTEIDTLSRVLQKDLTNWKI